MRSTLLAAVLALAGCTGSVVITEQPGADASPVPHQNGGKVSADGGPPSPGADAGVPANADASVPHQDGGNISADGGPPSPGADAGVPASADASSVPHPDGGNVSADGGPPAPGADAGVPPNADAGGCLGSALLGSLAKDHVLVGYSGEDSIGAGGGFDLQYRYLAGSLPDGDGPCASCAQGCTVGGKSCDNAHGCNWWGCWQYDQDPPGDTVRSFVATGTKNHLIPMITYYLLLQSSGAGEGPPEVAAANDLSFMKRYLADWRFVLKSLGSSDAFVHIEPDFWGYCQKVSSNPHTQPAAVASANPTDCAGMENSIAGLGRCMIAMTRKYAPKTRVGLHGSGWGTNIDVLLNRDASMDVAAQARRLGAFLKECGAADSDFLAVDACDRDAGFYESKGKNAWWDATNAALPSFHQAFAWAKALAEEVGKPILWWQVPVGNMAQPNTNQHWKDNRVDYFFAHLDELAASHVVGMAFGAGESQQTTPSTDGGNLVAKARAYAANGGQRLCR